MNSQVKEKRIGIRISDDTYNRLIKAEKELGRPKSTLVRQFIETMLFSIEKSKTERIDTTIEAVFQIMDVDNKIISKLEDNLIEFRSKIDMALEEVNEQRLYKSRNTRNLFSGSIE